MPGVPGMPERTFDDVVALVHQPVLRYLLRRASRDLAADVLGDVLLTLWRRRDDIPAEALPWCYGVARRCLANAVRGKRRQHALVAKIIIIDPPADHSEPTLEGDPTVDAALQSLSEDDRDILRLWAWEQLEAREIAEVLGVSANAASLRLHRARTRLRTRLTEAGPVRTQAQTGKEEHP